MNRLMPSFLKKLDAWLLLRYPRVWATRIHIFTFFSLIVCNIFMWLLTFSSKVSMERLPDNGTLQMTVILFALLSFLAILFWVSQFKAKLKTYTYWESLLCLAMCFGVIISLMINVQLYKAQMVQKVGRLVTEDQSNKDLLLLNILETCAFASQDNEKDTIEDLKFYDRTISKATLVKIVQLSKEVTRIQTVMDSLIEQYSRDSVSNEMLFAAISTLEITEEAKRIYAGEGKDFLYNDDIYENKWNAFNQYIQNDLKERYASMNNAEMTTKIREIYNCQNQKWRTLIFDSYYRHYGTLSYGYSHFIDNEQRSISLTQTNVDKLQREIEQRGGKNNYIHDFMNDNVIVILFLVFALFLLFNSAWRDCIITIISFCTAFAIYVLGMNFSRNNFSEDSILLTAAFFTVGYLLVVLTLWRNLSVAIENKQTMLIILLNGIPISFFALMAFMSNISRSLYSDYDNQQPFIYSLASILFYCFLIPTFTTLYHRLGGMSKYK
jgi:hypothetical protein